MTKKICDCLNCHNDATTVVVFGWPDLQSDDGTCDYDDIDLCLDHMPYYKHYMEKHFIQGFNRKSSIDFIVQVKSKGLWYK